MSSSWTVSLKRSIGDEDLTVFLKTWSDLMARECHAHRVWHSMFVRALQAKDTSPGTRFQLASVWAVNMIQGSYSFPGYVAALAARARSDNVRHGLLENAWDESGGTHHEARSHFWLAVRLGRLLGLTDVEMERIQPLQEAHRYVREHQLACTEADFEIGLGMICLIEEFTTPEFTLLFRALQISCETGAGIGPSEFVLGGGAEYFTANIADDERHRQEMPRLVAAALQERGVDLQHDDVLGALAGVLAGVRRSVELRTEFFDGIYRYVMKGGTYHALCRSSSD